MTSITVLAQATVVSLKATANAQHNPLIISQDGGPGWVVTDSLSENLLNERS